MRGLRAIDLFAGAGGFALGLRRAGWQIVGANDHDHLASRTFQLNFPEAAFFRSEISSLDSESLLAATKATIGETDCLIGGPPCQSFSYNNHHRNATDERSQLFRDYLRIVKGTLPKVVIMENVPGLKTISGGKVLDDIQREFSAIGYRVVSRVLHAEHYGTPQARRRLIIVGSRVGDPETLLPAPTHEHANVSVGAAIGDLPPVENGCSLVRRKYDKKPDSDYQKNMRRDSSELTFHVCTHLGSKNLQRIACVKEGGNWRQIPRHLLPAGMQRAKLTDHTKRYGRLSWSGLASTILTKCDPHWGAYIHPQQDRTITVREAARLQGFPDNFLFADVGITNMYQQIGNAVPIPLAEAIGNACTRHLIEHGAKNQVDV